MEISGFRHKGLERLWSSGSARGVSPRWAEKLRAMLTAIEEAETVDEVELFPGWKLHPLKGNRQGTWAMWITGNQRLTFRVDAGVASDFDIEDYHGGHG
jgi:proteic killer suppression protein